MGNRFGHFRKLLVMAVGMGLFSIPALAIFDEVGPPKQIDCVGRLLLAKKPIQGLMDLSDLLAEYDVRSWGVRSQDCSGRTICEFRIEDEPGVRLSYSYDNRMGSLDIEDLGTGQISTFYWANQYKLTQTGHLSARGELTSRRGGLLGEPQAFRIEFVCRGRWQ